jgi:Fe-S-cluster containining protein
MSDQYELEGQVEAGALFAHSALSAQAERINRLEAFVYGLADTLLEGGQVSEAQLRASSAAVAAELQDKNERLSAGVVLRIDADPPPADAVVDCAARIHICRAVCCRLSFALSAPEIEGGRVKWELGKPYYARRDKDGCCVHLDEHQRCGIHQDRPRVCRSYSCANDERIWKDFGHMVLNEEWIEQNLRPETRRLVAIRMERVS